MPDLATFLLICLDAIERWETKLLSWGIVDFAFDQDELSQIIYPLLDKALGEGLEGLDSELSVIEEMVQKCLLFSFERHGNRHFRTRMAETIRLMNRLRQLFPKHEGATKWRNAPTLVADFRFVRRPREYPKRDKTHGEFLQFLTEKINALPNQPIIEQLLSRGNSFLYSGFQCRATFDILDALIQSKSQGTIICAGTGSGKTLAFYIPAIYQVALRLSNDESPWVKAIAIYPRNELLKDQFSEVYSDVRRLDELLISKAKRKIKIGAFFGPTPLNGKYLNNESKGWKRTNQGYICTYIRCPSNNCNGELVWSDYHIDQDKEILTCNKCHHVINEDEISLTRQNIQKNPPDILFTTTEMLNRRMSDSYSRHVFGIGNKAKQSPDMVLLDEVHTYAGTHGAQVAYLMRRWKYLVKKNTVFVGLSATLREARSFFSEITGLRLNQVNEVAPHPEEMELEGSEYMLALRGDPVSKTSLLSTTIQTAMLISRSLDTKTELKSKGIYGSKIFVFTDDIDVTNRLYFDTLDAEGRDSWGNPNMRYRPKGSLACLRQSSQNVIRFEHGQDWRICECIGHILSNRMVVSRTSSQDIGVDMSADIVVATASLDVGFNDVNVGAILQHKAPRESAQFLQRKGRAGRTRLMRPWTIVVLSDYGRDKLAYQSYDQLFDPALNPRHLPINNRYVQRMQAAYALIDYLGTLPDIQNSNGLNVWKVLSSTASNNKEKDYHKCLAKALLSILQSEQVFEDFKQFLQNALLIDENAVLSLLWEYPRPLMTSVIATTLRRVKSNWAKDGKEGADYQIRDNPLPEFIPSNLFSDLNLPEVSIRIPPQTRNAQEEFFMMPISQAMREYAPGRVSRRFGIVHGGVRHWIAPQDIDSTRDQSIEIYDIGEHYLIGEYNYLDGATVKAIPVYRPFLLKPIIPQGDISDTSYGKLVWKTEIVPHKNEIDLLTPIHSGWEHIIQKISFYLHNHNNELEIRRFAHLSKASIVKQGTDNTDYEFAFCDKESPVALGFSMPVDGMVIKLLIPDNLWQNNNGYISEKWRSLRTQRYLESIISGDDVAIVSNVFIREWLARIFLSSVLCTAVEREVPIKDAATLVRDNEGVMELEGVLTKIFQSSFVPENESEEGAGEDKLNQTLREYLNDQETRNELYEAARCLWAPIDDKWQKWLERKYIATIAAAFRQAMQSLYPNIDMDSLVVDLDQYNSVADSNTKEIWITETSVGGMGIIENLFDRISKDPRNFFNITQSSLMPSEFEAVDDQLIKFLDLALSDNTDFTRILQNLRESSNFDSANRAFIELRSMLSTNGFVLFHSFIAALSNRIIKPGSNKLSDEFIREAFQKWSQMEESLNVEIDAMVFSYILSKDEAIDMTQLFDPIILQNMIGDIEAWRYNLIYGFLWPRGVSIRQEALSLYSIYSDIPATDRLLAVDTIQRKVNEIDIDDPQIHKLCLDYLSKHGIVKIFCGTDKDRLLKLKQLFNFLMTNPVEVDYILLYPRIREIRKAIASVSIEIELVEAFQ